jgi:hypothetical protein
MTEGFIHQTARDYDMPVHEVERIARLFPDQFYEKLEEFIADRSRKAEGGCMILNTNTLIT